MRGTVVRWRSGRFARQCRWRSSRISGAPDYVRGHGFGGRVVHWAGPWRLRGAMVDRRSVCARVLRRRAQRRRCPSLCIATRRSGAAGWRTACMTDADVYVELRCRSAFSFLAGASLPEDLVERRRHSSSTTRCRSSIAMASTVRRALSLPPSRRGCERWSEPIVAIAGRRLALLVAERRGYRNLCRLITCGKAAGARKVSASSGWDDLEAACGWAPGARPRRRRRHARPPPTIPKCVRGSIDSGRSSPRRPVRAWRSIAISSAARADHAPADRAWPRTFGCRSLPPTTCARMPSAGSPFARRLHVPPSQDDARRRRTPIGRQCRASPQVRTGDVRALSRRAGSDPQHAP